MARQKPKRMSITPFTKRYRTEPAGKDYLAHARWPEGFVCPACGSQKHCVLSNGLYQCGECHHQTSVTAGTFLHRSRVSLRKWFLALYLVTQDKRGISATQLAFSIGVNYKTAWRMLRTQTSQFQNRNKKSKIAQ